MSTHAVALEVVGPFQAEALLVFFGRHAVPGIESYADVGTGSERRIDYVRTLSLPYAPAVLRLSWRPDALTAALTLEDDHDLAAGRERVVQLCDLDRDPRVLEEHLGRDPELAPLVAASPGLRVPGVVDPVEHLIRTMVGQQISLAGAANCAGKLVARFGRPYPGRPGPSSGSGSDADAPTTVDRLFPTPDALAAADPETLPMPRARARALVGMAEALADGSVRLSRDGDLEQTRSMLLARPGVGPWTADYVLMRALHAPDVLLASDLVIKRELVRRGVTDTRAWAPWRSYATMHLWRSWTG